MYWYLYYFYFIKIILLIQFFLIKIGVITSKNKYYILMHTLFKFSLGLFMIVFFLTNKNAIKCLDFSTRTLFSIGGFMIVLLINYHEIFNILNQSNSYTSL
jgi:hypothetical protein